MSVPSITRFTSTTITVSWTGAASSIVIQESATNTSSLTTVGTYVVTSDITTYSVTYNTKSSFYYRATVNFLSGGSASTPLTQYQASSGTVPGFSAASNALNIENSESVPEIREDFGTLTSSTTKWTITNANRSTAPTTGDATIFVDGNTTSPYMVMSLDPFNTGVETAIESTTSLKMPFDVNLGISTSQRSDSQVMTVEAVSTDTESGLPTTQSTSLPTNIITHVQYAAGTITVYTSVPHGLVPGQIVSLYGLIDSRYNIPGGTVANVPQPTQFTITNITSGGITQLTNVITGATISAGGTSIVSATGNNFLNNTSIYVTAGTITGSTSSGGYTMTSGGLGVSSSGTSQPVFTPAALSGAGGANLQPIVAVPPPQTYTLASSSTSGITTVTSGSPNNFLNLTSTHGLFPGMTVAITGGGALSTSGIAGTNIYTVFALPTNVYPITSISLQPNVPVGDYAAGTISIVNCASVTASTSVVPFSTTNGSAASTGSIRIPTDVTPGAYSITGFTSGAAPLTMNTTNGLAIGMPIQLTDSIGGFTAGTRYFIVAITPGTISISATLGGGAINASGTSASTVISLAFAITNSTSGSAPLTMNSTAGLAVGMPIQLATPTAGFLAATTYYIQALTSTTISLATTSVAAAQTANANGASSAITIPYVSQSNLAISGVSSGVITTTTNHGLVIGNQVIFNVEYGGVSRYAARLPYYVASTPLANTFTLTGVPGGSAITAVSTATGLAAGNFTAYCSATCTASAVNTTGVLTISAPANIMALNAQVVLAGAVGGLVATYPYYISAAPTLATSLQLSTVPAGTQGQLTLSTSATIPSVPGQTVNYGRGYNSFPCGSIITIYGSSVLNGKQFYILGGTGTTTLTVMPVLANDTVPALTGINDTLIIVPTGGFVRFDPLSNRRNGSSMLLTSGSQTSAQFADRYEDSRGLASVSGTHTGTQTTSIGTTAPTLITTGIPGLNSFVPTNQFNYSQQVEGITWSDFVIDSAANIPAIRFKRNQYLPNAARSYNLRFRAGNFMNNTSPGAVLTNCIKYGGTTSNNTTIFTTETPHGLTFGDVITYHGIGGDVTNFQGLTTAIGISNILSPTSFMITQGGSVNAPIIAYGGFVVKVQGGRLLSGVNASIALGSISKSQNTITISVNAGGVNLAIGDYVNLYGIRAFATGGGLPLVGGVPVSLDGIYRYTTNIGGGAITHTFDMISDIYGNTRSPLLTSLPDFTSIAVGGGIIKRTDYRLHYVRANERKRLIIEPNNTRVDQSASFPVAITSSTSVPVTFSGNAANLSSTSTNTDVTSAAVTMAGATGANLTISSAITPTIGLESMITVFTTAYTAGAGSTYSGVSGGTYNTSAAALDVGVDESDDSGTTWYRVYDFPRITGIGVVRSPKLLLSGNRLRYSQVALGMGTAAISRSITRNTLNGIDGPAITTKPPNVITDQNAISQLTPITAYTVTPLASTFTSTNLSTNPNASTILPWVNTATPTYIGFAYQITSAGSPAAIVSQLIEESYDGGTTWVPFYKFPAVSGVGYYTSPKLPYTSNPLRITESFLLTPSGTFTRSHHRLEYYENSALPNAVSPNFIVDQQPNYVNTNTNERTTVVAPSAGTSFVVAVPLAVNTASSQTVDFRIDESFDGGNTWIRLYDFGRYTFSSATSTVLVTPKLALSGNRLRYAITTSNSNILRGIYRWQYDEQVPVFKQFIDRTIVLSTLNSTTPTYTVTGAKNIQLSLLASSAAGGTLQIQGSDDGVNWVNLLGTALTVPTSSALVTSSVANNPFQFVRAIVATTTTTPVLSYLMMKAFN